MVSHRARILIADDHTLVAELCKRVLENEFDVAGIVGDGHAMIRAAAELKNVLGPLCGRYLLAAVRESRT